MYKIMFATSLLIATGAVNAAPITELTITGGSFWLGSPDVSANLNPAAFANLTIGGYDGTAPIGVGSSEADYAPTSIGTLDLAISDGISLGPMAVYTSPSNNIGITPQPVTGDLTGNTLTLVLSSWTSYWNGSQFNTGNHSYDLDETPITTTYDLATGAFTATWETYVWGPFGLPAGWTVTGTVSAVPVPPAAWLFGSGLLGIIGMAVGRWPHWKAILK